MRALVVDDSRMVRAALRSMLGQLGFDVYEASDGQEGLARLTDGVSFAVALVDWNMPRMNGLELVAHVRAIAALSNVRIVMVTTEVEMESVSRALGAGADEYLMKPFTREMVEDKLRLVGVLAP